MSDTYAELVRTGTVDAPPCTRAMQNHLRKRFLDAQGPSSEDSAARARRIENAKRYADWQARGSALSSTGQRPA